MVMLHQVMHGIELQNHDLNLLVTLRALLETRSVSGAARELGLSPSAASHALSRLREAFGDPLLVRDGNAMVPTPRAQALAPSLARVLDEAKLLYRETPTFDPASSTREFTIGASDLLAPLTPDLAATLRHEAPAMGLAFVAEVPPSDTSAFATGGIDLGLQANPAPRAGLRTRLLGQVEFVLVARPGHPFLSQPSLEAWCNTGHVVVSTGRPGAGYVGEAIARAGIERRVALRVPTFLLAMHVLVESDLLFAAPGALAKPIAERLGLVTARIPLNVPRVEVAAVWHERFDEDPGHRWFRERVSTILELSLQGSDSRRTNVRAS